MSGPQILKRGFGAGLRWLPAGAELLARHWRPLLGVASLWLLASLLASLIPVLGQIALMLLTPLLTAGLLFAFDRAISGVDVRPSTLFIAWSQPKRRTTLLGLGVFSLLGTFLAAMVFAGWLTSQIDPALLEASLSNPEALSALLQEASLGLGIVLAVSLFLVVIAGLFLAVPVVMFGGLSLGNALVYSYRACFSNLPALLGLLLATVGFGLALGFLIVLIVSILSLALGSVGQFFGQLVMVAATLFAQVVLSGTQYVAFCELSGWRPGPDPDNPDDEMLA